jgi:hypothetical protein
MYIQEYDGIFILHLIMAWCWRLVFDFWSGLIAEYHFVTLHIKARLHGRFLLRFSPFGGYEGVDYLIMLL